MNPLHIRAASNTAAENAAVEALGKTIAQYDLSPWIFTNEVVIEEGAIPHSYPVLTLATRNGGDFQLASLLHEQIHWFCAAHDADADRAYLQELQPRYAVLPVAAQEEESTYLHLIVCWLEIDALIRLRGRAIAETVATGAAAAGLYPWVYRTVLSDFEVLDEIYTRHNLLIGAA